MMARFGQVSFVVLMLVLISSVSTGQTASDFGQTNLKFQDIRTNMVLLMDTGEGSDFIQIQQIILSGADNYRARTRAWMVYLQLLDFVTEPSKITEARLELVKILEEEIPMDRQLEAGYKRMSKTSYGKTTQSIAEQLSRIIGEMINLEEDLLGRLKNTTQVYDWLGE